MRKILLIPLLLTCFFVKAQTPVNVSQPQKFLKRIYVEGSLLVDSIIPPADSTNKGINSAWARRTFAPITGGGYIQNKYGLNSVQSNAKINITDSIRTRTIVSGKELEIVIADTTAGGVILRPVWSLKSAKYPTNTVNKLGLFMGTYRNGSFTDDAIKVYFKTGGGLVASSGSQNDSPGLATMDWDYGYDVGGTYCFSAKHGVASFGYLDTVATHSSYDFQTLGTSIITYDKLGNVGMPRLNITGTGGLGYAALNSQTSTPATPASGIIIYASNTANRFGFLGSNGFPVNLSSQLITAARTPAIADNGGTLVTMPSPVLGGIPYALSTSTFGNLPIGSTGDILRVAPSGVPDWVAGNTLFVPYTGAIANVNLNNRILTNVDQLQANSVVQASVGTTSLSILGNGGGTFPIVGQSVNYGALSLSNPSGTNAIWSGTLSGTNQLLYSSTAGHKFYVNGTTLALEITPTGLIGNGSGLTNLTAANISAGTAAINITGSAATLTTTRTIWGQNFNGSANVSGAMSGITTLAMGGALSGATTVTASSHGIFNGELRIGSASVQTQTINSGLNSIKIGSMNGFYANSAASQIFIYTNGYSDASGVDTYVAASNNASKLTMNGATLTYQTAGMGSSGSPITYVTPFSVSSAGNGVFLGTLGASNLSNINTGDQTTSSANSDISVATGGGNPVLTFNRVLANGVTATTQSAGDNSTKVATTAYADTKASYSEGTWTPSGADITANYGTYIRIGNQVTCYFDISVDINSDPLAFHIETLPFTCSATSYGSVIVSSLTGGTLTDLKGIVITTTDYCLFRTSNTGGVNVTRAQLSNSRIVGTITYRTN